MLRHSVAPTIKSPGTLHEAFVDLLGRCSRIMCLDAFLGDLTMEFLKHTGENRDAASDSPGLCSLINTHRPRPRKFRVTNNEATWTESIIQDLENNKRVVVPTMSAEQAARLATRVKQRFPNLERRGVWWCTRACKRIT